MTVFRKDKRQLRLNPWEISKKKLGQIQGKQDEHLDFFGCSRGIRQGKILERY